MSEAPWRLILGDCLDPVTGLASLPDGSVDHVLTDPPYAEHTHTKSVRGNGHRPGGKRQDLGFAHMTDVIRSDIASHAARVCNRWNVVFCDERSDHLWAGALESVGLEYIRTGVWLKENATPQFTGDRPACGWEAIVLAHQPGRKRWNAGGKPDVWSCPTAYRNGDEVVHTTQKPLALMESLILDFTDPGDLICDPFAGSGTTGVAAIRLGRRFIGWERDPKYHAAAVRRLEGTREQLSLLERPARKPKQENLL